MSVIVRIPGPLRKITDGADKVEVTADNLKGLIHELDKQYPGIKDRILDENEDLRYFVNLYLNNEDVRFLDGLSTSVKSGDEVSIVPAVAGGCQTPRVTISLSLNERDPEYNERELAEIEELNRLSDHNPEITQSKLWRRLTIFVAIVIVCSLLLPIAALIFNSSNSTTSGRDEVRTSTNIPTPNFELIDTNGHSIKLSTELENNPVVILIFYRGFF